MNIQRVAIAGFAAFAVTAAIAQAQLPVVNAEVRKIDAAKGTVLLKHQEIPNMGMSAMTMQFDLKDKKMLAGVKPGDMVQFTADMVGGKPTVMTLRRSTVQSKP
jgi:Cu(I)/Ag(I) efflux system membrane protein CusA/SilA